MGVILGCGAMVSFLGSCVSNDPAEPATVVNWDELTPEERRERAWSGFAATNPEIDPAEMGSTLETGMAWSEALVMLKAHGATPTPFQVIGGLHFHLPSGDSLELNWPEAEFQDPKTVSRMVLGRYRRKSWNNKEDPERTKFFQSFVEIETLDLTEHEKPASDDSPS